MRPVTEQVSRDFSTGTSNNQYSIHDESTALCCALTILFFIKAEISCKVFGDVIGNVKVQIAPQILHQPPVLLRRASGSPVPLEEEGLDGGTKLGKFLRRREILGIKRDQLGTLTLVYKLQDLVGVHYSTFSGNYGIPYLYPL